MYCDIASIAIATDSKHNFAGMFSKVGEKNNWQCQLTKTKLTVCMS